MLRSHRTRHRWIWLLIAVVVPACCAIALASRTAPPTAGANATSRDR